MTARGSYLQVKQHVFDQIRSGAWRPGQLIPKEQALAEAFGCARMTVHRALRELAEEGLVERRRRSGTRVALRTERATLIDVPRIEDEIASTGASYRYRRLSRRIVRPAAALAGHLRLATGADALRVECLHYANDVPFQFEERWINLESVPEARAESFRERSPNAWLLATRPWFDVEHIISAANAEARVAERLELTVGEALMVVERRTWDGDSVITFARMMHPGTFYRIRTAGQRDQVSASRSDAM
ncbi:MAG: UTRA domain-containing protein [Pseudomonadota bacterium]